MAQDTVTDAPEPASETLASSGSLAGPLDDVRWAYENYANDKVTEKDAPSAGAWGLLNACKQERNVYLKVLERVHPRDAGPAGLDSSVALLDLEQQVRNEWKQLVVVLETASKRPEFCPALLEFTQQWRADHPPEKFSPQRTEARSRLVGLTDEDVPL